LRVFAPRLQLNSRASFSTAYDIMKHVVSSALAATILLLAAAPASAQLKDNPDRYCRDGYFTRESKEYRLATIKGAAGERAYFHDDDPEKCPADPSCRLKTYVIANDQVIVSRTLGKFACSWFQPRRGTGTTGWIETDRLKWTGSIKPPGISDWIGTWRTDGTNFIRIKRAKKAGELDIEGEATAGLAPNTGELGHTAKPSGDTMKFADAEGEGSCEVEMQLVGKFLIVDDNLKCGGANVSFSGVYQKRR
jgi:hypothetical protein